MVLRTYLAAKSHDVNLLCGCNLDLSFPAFAVYYCIFTLANIDVSCEESEIY